MNAGILADYPSLDRRELLDELARAATELVDYLESLSPDEWRRETGVSFRSVELVVRDNVDELIADHHHHVGQLPGRPQAFTTVILRIEPSAT